MQTIYKISTFVKAITLLFLSCMVVFPAMAQEKTTSMENSMFFSPYIYLLLFVILILILVIVALGKVLVMVAKSNVLKKDSTIKVIGLIILAGLSFSPGITLAADGQAPISSSYYGIPADVFFLLMSVIIIQLIVVYVLLQAINKFFKTALPVEAVTQKKERSWLWKKLDDSVPIEEEQSILTDHVYDGIRELDNGMPPWLRYMFIATIVFAVVYLFDYHVVKSSPLQLEEYNKELADAEIEMQNYRKKSANNIDESNVVLLTDAASLSEGEKVYKASCTACHGQLGEGLVGPNFTDDYWIHGGDIKDLFKIIKYGVVEKGMKSWQAEISPKQMQDVASYIKKMRGTNPPNQKEKQGDLYIEKAGSDSTTKDNLIPTPDSLKLSANK